jgi:small subunit ribosomal protein S17
MKKTLLGKIVAVKDEHTAIVEVTRKISHPLYRKILTRSKRFQVALDGKKAELNQQVVIEETPKVSKHKYFKVTEVHN